MKFSLVIRQIQCEGSSAWVNKNNNNINNNILIPNYLTSIKNSIYLSQVNSPHLPLASLYKI